MSKRPWCCSQHCSACCCAAVLLCCCAAVLLLLQLTSIHQRLVGLVQRLEGGIIGCLDSLRGSGVPAG